MVSHNMQLYLVGTLLVLCLLLHHSSAQWRPQGRFGKRTGHIEDEELLNEEPETADQLAAYEGKLSETNVPIFTTRKGQICVRDNTNGLYKCLQRKSRPDLFH